MNITISDGKSYDARAGECPRLWCWQPGLYDHYGGCGSGMRNTGMSTHCCLYRAYHGCPQPIPTTDDLPPWETAA